MEQRLEHTGQGVTYLLVAIAIFSVQDVIIKMISDDFAVHQVFFLRCLSALPIIVIVAWATQGIKSLHPKNLHAQFWRAVCIFFAYSGYYLALASLSLADAVALFFSAPIFVTLLSIFFLGEHVGKHRWFAVAIGFLGMLVMVRPGASVFDPAALLAIASALAYAVQVIISRRAAVTETAGALAFWALLFNLFFSLIAGAIISFVPLAGSAHASIEFLTRAWIVPPQETWFFFGVLASTTTAGFYLLSQAYRIAQPSKLVLFEYAALPWGLLWTFVFWKTVPDTVAFFGMGLIVFAGIYIFEREIGIAHRTRWYVLRALNRR